MFKLFEYIRLRSIGFSAIDAIRFNYVRVKLIEKLIFCVLALFILANYTLKSYVAITTAVQTVLEQKAQENLMHIKVNETLHYQVMAEQRKVTTLELAFISCLNNNGVVVGKRTMNCVIKDYY